MSWLIFLLFTICMSGVGSFVPPLHTSVRRVGLGRHSCSATASSSGTGWERRLSDSHLYAFERDSVLPLRRVFESSSLHGMLQDRGSMDLVDVENIGGQVACRLLDSPSSFFIPGGQDDIRGGVKVLVPLQDFSTIAVSGSSPRARANYELDVGDCLAISQSSGPLSWSKLPKDDDHVILELSYVGIDCVEKTDEGEWRLNAVSGVANSCPVRLTFEDELHGKRGYTPTTVVQWSKGIPPSGQQWYN